MEDDELGPLKLLFNMVASWSEKIGAAGLVIWLFQPQINYVVSLNTLTGGIVLFVLCYITKIMGSKL